MKKNKKPHTTHGSEQNEVVDGQWNKDHLEFTIAP